MSASTVSITARRRTVVAGDDVSTPVSDSGKSPIPSISGDIQMKKKQSYAAPGPALAVYGRRSHLRKEVARSEKPKWFTVLSVLAKNLLLLVLLIGLIQMIRSMVYNRSDDGFLIRAGSELEKRIADVEGLLEKTTKKLQDQVEVVDKKLESELNGVRVDLSKKIDEKKTVFENELKKIDGSVESLERALGDLRTGEWIKKEDVDGLIEEFRKTKGGGSNDVDLDEVREGMRGMVERELERHAGDGLGRVDYAVASGGGMVASHSERYAFVKGIGLFNRVKNGVHDDAVKMLSPSFGEPGQCFPLKGSSGFVQIKLRTAIIPEAVTLEHVSKSVAFDRKSAPKDCRISGWLQKQDSTGPAVETGKMILLAEFAYDLEKSNAQTFDMLDTHVIDTIRFDFTSNHGNPALTCIYRLRVHGREPDSVLM